MKRGDAGRLALGAALVAGLVVAGAHRDAIGGDNLAQWIAQAEAWAPVVFVALYATATVFFLPGSVLTLAAGALFGPLTGALYSLAGATVGATLAFLAARHLAGDWASRKAGPRLGRLMDGVDAEGWRFVGFVRLVPLFPFNLVNYALGLTRIGVAPYVLASAVCMLPGALAYAWLGHAGREAIGGSDGAIRNALLALALLAAVAFLPRIARRFRSADVITPERLRALLAEGDVQVVDLRDAPEFRGEAGHIGGARNIPLPELPSRIEELAAWREGGLILICRTHVRSGKAARLLAARGFGGLLLVRGGMNAWRKLGYPTETAAAAPGSFNRLEVEPA